jgi:hypothetical protein
MMFPLGKAIQFDKAVEAMGGRPAGPCPRCSSARVDLPYATQGKFGIETRHARVCFECDHGADIPRVKEAR